MLKQFLGCFTRKTEVAQTSAGSHTSRDLNLHPDNSQYLKHQITSLNSQPKNDDQKVKLVCDTGVGPLSVKVEYKCRQETWSDPSCSTSSSRTIQTEAPATSSPWKHASSEGLKISLDSQPLAEIPWKDSELSCQNLGTCPEKGESHQVELSQDTGGLSAAAIALTAASSLANASPIFGCSQQSAAPQMICCPRVVMRTQEANCVAPPVTLQPHVISRLSSTWKHPTSHRSTPMILTFQSSSPPPPTVVISLQQFRTIWRDHQTRALSGNDELFAEGAFHRNSGSSCNEGAGSGTEYSHKARGINMLGTTGEKVPARGTPLHVLRPGHARPGGTHADVVNAGRGSGNYGSNRNKRNVALAKWEEEQEEERSCREATLEYLKQAVSSRDNSGLSRGARTVLGDTSRGAASLTSSLHPSRTGNVFESYVTHEDYTQRSIMGVDADATTLLTPKVDHGR
ncbi:hypothetical protein CEUSTIGMA_g10319.t1 [Chlamydomonas eustigma]|uniref:Uncharacterized protein n=1 Tax=Chlamydomonas eustigma TaxID=1157962 RepID=A0A250XIM8_9CHLO|nr:hypothetical protein CEUSTIGMA_g10319.t1 [Chlamydomonas eustigma]|eukprot:GAX82893.1 hypothetical protein CEUSTIGMA_g10319.t1 [Chlamydomonas eustigma]